ncbi:MULTISPECIES: hypothetical protein [Campylobacter]|uniref:hypothetical protein n=1 Tax=Campylobacter TaxID=194 RepID=UPI000A33DF09|nr:hypothetical protein [Campylobacter sp. RM8835]MCR8701867.1 hypothetical protein [Campylobacter sp. RM12176]
MAITCTYTPTKQADISMNIKDLTNGSKVRNGQFFEWEGSAILDTFINVLGKNIEIQFDNGRILGSDFASAYIQMLQIASAQSMAWIQLSKDLALKQRDLDMKDNANVTEFCIKNRKADMEEAVAQRQIDGYDDNIGIKLLQTQFDAFSMIFSSGMVDLGDGDNALGPLNRSNLTETYNSLATRFPSHPKYKKK